MKIQLLYSMKSILFFLSLSLVSCFSSAQESDSQQPENTFPEPLGVVNDYDSIFTVEEKKEISSFLIDYETKTTRQIAIPTVASISPYTDVLEYATDLANEWGAGTKEENNGIVIVICMPERNIGIALGTGTMKEISNEICQEIIQSVIIPEFKQGKLFDGTMKGVEALIKVWDN